ncbi:MAG TPA: protein kinase [Vicinamibacterales bacterium]|nr:protein kinase [Vicinamibacterales bacterium]
MIGTRLAHYEITAHLGTGGMGEVYQATDGKLGRSVAIKLLPQAFAKDEERVARFEREARLLASLNHPNIATIHGLEESGAQKFLVMELVPGETLAERIVQGPFPVDEALGVAKAIAEGLEAAHEHGVIHRDLKPANVKITPDGRVKVLDFGLAKAFAGGDQTDAGVSESPTITAAATQRGVILGTAAYMSPEQARGRSVDRRTDIWALGCVLYESLAARQAFPGDTVTDILANVVKSEPDWTALPADTPAAARALLRSCLQKDPRRRCQHVGDARIAIEEAIAQPVTSAELPVAMTTAAVARPLWRRTIPILVSAIVAGAIASALTWYLVRPGPPAVVRFPIAIPEERQLRQSKVLDVSPDGTRLAYTAGGQLFLHDFAKTEARAITDKDVEAHYPLFSPDGSWIVFWSRNDLMLKKVAVDGGMTLPLCRTNYPLGLSWHGESIVFATGGGGIQRVSENGGEPETLIASRPGEVWDGPQLLNGGTAVLYTIAQGLGADRWDKARVVVQSLASGEPKVIVENGSAARYLPTGHLMYAVGGTLMAVAFDPVSLEKRGRAVPVEDGIVRSANPASTGASAQIAWSNAGTLAYVRGLGSATQLRLALFHRNGTTEPLPLQAREWQHPRVSPDGSQLVVGTDDGREAAVWIYALKSGGEPRRLTFEGRNTSPIWMPDGKHVTFQSDREGDLALFTQQADGKPAERLAKPEAGFSFRPEAWSKGGILAFLKFGGPAGIADLWTLSEGGGSPKPLVELPDSNQRFTAFHPSGQWFAYASSELSRGTTNFHVFVQPFPPTGRKFQASASSSNGFDPVWSLPDGKRLFYIVRPANEVVVVDIDPTSGFVGKPSPVRGLRVQIGGPGRGYDIMPDGTFVTVLPPDSSGRPAEQITIVLNWFEELKRLVPVH